MAKGGIRRFDVQAKWSMIFSIAAALGCLSLAAGMSMRWQGDLHQFVFSAQSLYQPVVICTSGLTILLALFGTALGFSSAGQRRNDKQKMSWLGFFLGAGSLSISFVLFAGFYFFSASMMLPAFMGVL